MNNELKVVTKQNFMGQDIPVVLGGFGEGKKCISDKTIAEIHNQPDREIRRRITDNIKRFRENVDIIDLKQRVGESHTLEILLNIGYSKQAITQAEHIYILSERGYAKLIKIMDTDLAWEIHDKLMDEYFEIREQKTIDRAQLSPQMQMLMGMVESQAKQELEQKRQAEKLNKLEENQKVINTALTGQMEEDFKHWVNRCLSAIAESENYAFIGTRQERHQAVRTESYQRLNAKRPCRLEQRVKLEKGRAFEAGASKTKIDAINKLYIIENDKDLKPVYESVIKEMLIAFCVEV